MLLKIICFLWLYFLWLYNSSSSFIIVRFIPVFRIEYMKTAIPTVTFVWLFQNLIFTINKIQNEVSSSAPSFPYATNYSFILYPYIFHDFQSAFPVHHSMLLQNKSLWVIMKEEFNVLLYFYPHKTYSHHSILSWRLWICLR